MSEQLIAMARDGIALTVANIVGGTIAGILLTFYRDIAINVLADGPRRMEARWMRRSKSEVGSVSVVEDPNESRLSVRYLKAATFAIGVTIIVCMFAIIPFHRQGVIEPVGSIAIGLVLGALVEHAAWRAGTMKKRRALASDDTGS
jgi:hypothetical protein